ncbi:adenosylcobyric acid synthase (glutamine-hydrolysing) [Hymenobacter psychrophilus]|uniref:Cobyric acid synthase n=2 Tax=Hymenobacter psychrophilus TaxID=651662 RepID=A0A1H3L527_9BACT|nr:adenosylcobyric acid synthase (glutamine-hydrolysing) [Hymenobacter psychrophilus]
MFVGTASDVGKSVITAGFCRIFRQDGYQPAPFKAQNMSLNSYATPEGLEIGRAQAVQAEAAGIACHVDMNPVLLKPTSDQASQVVLNGRPIGTQTAYEYFRANDRHELFAAATQAYDRLAARFSPVVLEGAGSISELNLKRRDITNLRMAQHAGAATYLIADIDKGGVFGSVYGTLALLEPAEKACIKGIIINKFRGDARLFADGRQQLEDLTGVPVVGVLPYFRDIFVEEEDSVVLAYKQRRARLAGRVRVAVVLLGRMSNFTDFDVLNHDARTDVFFTHEATEINEADIIILPGSKNTIADLLALQRSGLAAAIVAAHAAGKTVVGICGGYQMLGRSVEDPDGVEGRVGAAAGLGLLPVRTVLQGEKTTRQRQFSFRDERPASCRGYEIHMGQTLAEGPPHPVATLDDGTPDGYFAGPHCWGTYLHGILDNPVVIDALLAPHTRQIVSAPVDFVAFKNEQYDRLAALIRENVDMQQIYAALQS